MTALLFLICSFLLQRALFHGVMGCSVLLGFSFLIVLSSKIPSVSLSLPRVVRYRSITITSFSSFSSSSFFFFFFFLPCHFVSLLPCYSQRFRQKVPAVMGIHNVGLGLIRYAFFLSYYHFALGTGVWCVGAQQTCSCVCFAT